MPASQRDRETEKWMRNGEKDPIFFPYSLPASFRSEWSHYPWLSLLSCLLSCIDVPGAPVYLFIYVFWIWSQIWSCIGFLPISTVSQKGHKSKLWGLCNGTVRAVTESRSGDWFDSTRVLSSCWVLVWSLVAWWSDRVSVQTCCVSKYSVCKEETPTWNKNLTTIENVQLTLKSLFDYFSRAK